MSLDKSEVSNRVHGQQFSSQNSQQQLNICKQVLADHLQQSKAKLSNIKFLVIQQLIQFREDKVFALETDNRNSYFDLYERTFIEEIMDVIKDKVSQKNNRVIDDLENNKQAIRSQRIITSTSQVIANQISSSRIRHKKSQTTNNNQQQHSVCQSNRANSNNNLQNIRSFLKNIQQKQRITKIRLQQYNQHQKQQKQLSLKQQQQIKQIKLTQRMRQYKQKLIQKRKKKEVQKSQILLKQQQFKQFVNKLNRYQNKPLFQQKQQEFDKLESMRREQIKNKKSVNNKLDTEEIKNHQLKYQKRRKQLEMQRIEKIDKLKTERSVVMSDRLYKGKYYHNQDKVKDRSMLEKERSVSVRDRINKFNNVIRQNYKPKIDQKKKEEIKQYIEQEQKKQKIKSCSSYTQQQNSQINARALGNRYLKQFKRNTSQIPKTFRLPPPSSIPPPSSHRSYLRLASKNLKPSLSSWKKQINSLTLSSQQKFQLVLYKTNNLTVQAQIKQNRLYHQPKSIQLNQSIDDCYINSIQAKLQLMKLNQ